VSAPRRCEVCDCVNLEKESAVFNEANLPWFEMFALKYSVHQMKIPCPLKRRNCGTFPERGPIECRKGKPVNLERMKSRDGVEGWKVPRGWGD
jgi:hypothetical protein